MKNENLEHYMENERSIRYVLYHFQLGLQQLLNSPICIIGFVLLVCIETVLWNYKDLLKINISPEINLLYEKIIFGFLVILFIVILILYISCIGESVARRYEGRLMVAFTSTDLRGGTPILTYLRRDRKKKIIVMSYYSMISKKVWEERREYIEDALNVRVIGTGIDYGGKNKDNGNLITIYVTNGRKPKERGIMYEEEL